MAAVATAEPVTIQQAFESAKAQHSAAAERAQGTEASPASTETGTQADESTAQTPPADSATPETDLISDAELTALREKHKDNPDALAKELKAVFTKKTQALAVERKQVERLSGYSDFIDAIEAGGDSAADAIRQAAEHFGLQIAPKLTAAQTTAATATDTLLESFKAKLGPDLAFLADSLAPAVKAVVEDAVKTAVGEATKPIQEATSTLIDRATQEQTDTLLKGFSERYPDWKTHEPAMLKIAESFQPGPKTTPDAYLESLYFLATKDARIDAEVKKVVAKMTTGAATAETRTSTVSGDRVTTAPPAGASFKDAFAAAKQGKRWA